MNLEGTAAIVTGGASGLGAATATALAARGATVHALDLTTAVGSAPTVDGVTHVVADVTDPAQVAAAIDGAMASGLPLRVVVNCAGIAPSKRTVTRTGPHETALFASVLAVNLVGTFSVMASAASAMAGSEAVDGQRGVIINTASIAAYDGQTGQVAYAASKGGIVAMTLPAARDLARFGIRVCTIAPGVMETPLVATVSEEFRDALIDGVQFPRRLGRPEEFAALALAIVDHDYLNGETIRMDGALRMSAT